MPLLKSRVVRMSSVFVGLALLLSFAGCQKETLTPASKKPTSNAAVAPAGEANVSQKTCPVTGEPIDKKVYVEHDGKKVYFCCKKCVAIFKKDPEKYVAKLEGKAAAKTGEHKHEHDEHK